MMVCAALAEEAIDAEVMEGVTGGEKAFLGAIFAKLDCFEMEI